MISFVFPLFAQDFQQGSSIIDLDLNAVYEIQGSSKKCTSHIKISEKLFEALRLKRWGYQNCADGFSRYSFFNSKRRSVYCKKVSEGKNSYYELKTTNYTWSHFKKYVEVLQNEARISALASPPNSAEITCYSVDFNVGGGIVVAKNFTSDLNFVHKQKIEVNCMGECIKFCIEIKALYNTTMDCDDSENITMEFKNRILVFKDSFFQKHNFFLPYDNLQFLDMAYDSYSQDLIFLCFNPKENYHEIIVCDPDAGTNEDKILGKIKLEQTSPEEELYLTEAYNLKYSLVGLKKLP